MDLHTRNRVSLIDISPVRFLYIRICYAYKAGIPPDSLNDQTKKYSFKKITPKMERYIRNYVADNLIEPYATMVLDLLEGEFVTNDLNLRIVKISNFIECTEALWVHYAMVERLTWFDFQLFAIFRELLYKFAIHQDKIFEPLSRFSDAIVSFEDIKAIRYYYCNMDTEDGWVREYREPLAEYFSQSVLLRKHYRDYIDLVNGDISPELLLVKWDYLGTLNGYAQQALHTLQALITVKMLRLELDEETSEAIVKGNLLELTQKTLRNYNGSLKSVYNTFRGTPALIELEESVKKKLNTSLDKPEKTILGPSNGKINKFDSRKKEINV